MKKENTESLLEWSEKIKNQAASGQSIAAWCQDHDIAYHTFLYWRKRLQQSFPSTENPSKRSSFLELAKDPPQAWLEINLPGVRLEISKGFDRSAVLCFLQILKAL
jgi:hypothetical protein